MADPALPIAYARRHEWPAPHCPDCDQPGDPDWLDVSKIGDAEMMVLPGRIYCRTSGCVREGGWWV